MTVTRGQTVTFLYRAVGAPAVSGGSFADVAADAYYADAVAWAVKEGITSGTGAPRSAGCSLHPRPDRDLYVSGRTMMSPPHSTGPAKQRLRRINNKKRPVAKRNLKK